MKLLLIFLTLTSINCEAQSISSNLFVNGINTNENNTISRSIENILTVEGKGCDTFLLSGTGVSLAKTNEGWVAVPSGRNLEVYIDVSCKKSDGKTYRLVRHRLKVIQ